MQLKNTCLESEKREEALVRRRKSRPLESMEDLRPKQTRKGPKPVPVELRFHKLYDIADSGCWEWNKRLSCGYGEMRVARYNVKAHRVSWILHRGSIPSGMLVCHKCNNKKCVNPDHLYLGTCLVNVSDAIRDGLRSSGEDMWNAKLTNKDVSKMRKIRVKTGKTYQELADMFGVSKPTIAHIFQGITWRSVI